MFTYTHSRSIPKNNSFDFHLHNFYEIYLFLSGGVNYFVEKTVYPLSKGDMIIINSNEIHKPSFYNESMYERITIHFDPNLILKSNISDLDLLECFTKRSNGEKNLISLDAVQFEKIYSLMHEIGTHHNSISFGANILKMTSFIDLLVYINSFHRDLLVENSYENIPLNLIPILEYIDKNLEDNLSLSSLEDKFHINKFYLERLFKKYTGSKLHQYIILKRISKAKKLLLSDYTVTEAAMYSGFNDLSNFFRMFKKTIGITPGEFKKANL